MCHHGHDNAHHSAPCPIAKGPTSTCARTHTLNLGACVFVFHPCTPVSARDFGAGASQPSAHRHAPERGASFPARRRRVTLQPGPRRPKCTGYCRKTGPVERHAWGVRGAYPCRACAYLARHALGVRGAHTRSGDGLSGASPCVCTGAAEEARRGAGIDGGTGMLPSATEERRSEVVRPSEWA